MLHTAEKTRRDKQALYIGAMLILLVGVYFATKGFLRSEDTADEPATQSEEESLAEVPFITVEVLWQRIQNNEKIDIIDIRENVLYESEHIAQSLSIPIGSLESFAPSQDSSVVVIFTESDRQVFETAKNVLQEKPFPHFFLQGGFEAWKSFGAPTISFGNPNSFLDQSKVTYIELSEFKALLASNDRTPYILDVQSKENYTKKHIKGAINIPLGEIEKRRSEIPAGIQIVVYGENDTISFQGGVRLADLGIFAVKTLTGNTYLTPTSGIVFEP